MSRNLQSDVNNFIAFVKEGGFEPLLNYLHDKRHITADDLATFNYPQEVILVFTLVEGKADIERFAADPNNEEEASLLRTARANLITHATELYERHDVVKAFYDLTFKIMSDNDVVSPSERSEHVDTESSANSEIALFKTPETITTGPILVASGTRYRPVIRFVVHDQSDKAIADFSADWHDSLFLARGLIGAVEKQINSEGSLLDEGRLDLDDISDILVRDCNDLERKIIRIKNIVKKISEY